MASPGPAIQTPNLPTIAGQEGLQLLDIYDPSIFVEREPSLLCGLCRRVMAKAEYCDNGFEQMTIQACVHAFCETCIRIWLEKNTVCPTCHQPLRLDQLRPDGSVRRALASKQVRCLFADKGCSWVHTYGTDGQNLAAHLVSCAYGAVPCTNKGCAQKLKRGEFKMHTEEKCAYRSFPCPYQRFGCKQVSTNQTEKADHMAESLAIHLELAVGKVIELETNQTEIIRQVNLAIKKISDKVKFIYPHFDELRKEMVQHRHDLHLEIEETRTMIGTPDPERFQLEWKQQSGEILEASGPFENKKIRRKDSIVDVKPTFIPRKVKIPGQFLITTFAGSSQGHQDGNFDTSKFNYPCSLCFDLSGNLIVADRANHRIRRISFVDQVITTLAGGDAFGCINSYGLESAFSFPLGVCMDKEGSIFVADSGNNVIRKIEVNGIVSTFAGTGMKGMVDGEAKVAQFNNPMSVACDSSGNIYVADRDNHAIRKISPKGVVTNLAGDGVRGLRNGGTSNARFDGPCGLTVDAEGSVYVADQENHAIRKIKKGVVSTIAGKGMGYRDGPIDSATFRCPTSIVIDKEGSLFVSDRGNHCIRKINTTGTVSTVVGNGDEAAGHADGYNKDARLSSPWGLCLDPRENCIYVTDRDNHMIKKIE